MHDYTLLYTTIYYYILLYTTIHYYTRLLVGDRGEETDFLRNTFDGSVVSAISFDLDNTSLSQSQSTGQSTVQSLMMKNKKKGRVDRWESASPTRTQSYEPDSDATRKAKKTLQKLDTLSKQMHASPIAMIKKAKNGGKIIKRSSPKKLTSLSRSLDSGLLFAAGVGDLLTLTPSTMNVPILERAFFFPTVIPVLDPTSSASVIATETKEATIATDVELL